MVVVARHHQDRAPGEGLAEGLEEGPDLVEHHVQRALSQLDRVAEQDQPVGVGERGQQPVAGVTVPSQVAVREHAEVEV